MNNTYSELNDWTKSIFDNFGKIILFKHYDNYDKINIYKDNIKELKNRLETKIKLLKNNDFKSDLKELLIRVNILDDYLNKNI